MKDSQRTKERGRAAKRARAARRNPKVRQYFGLDHAKACIRVNDITNSVTFHSKVI